MSSTTRLLVLGVVRIFQPVHGYDVRRELVSWHAHEWASVKPGSIYNALKSLTHDGFLEVVGTDQVGGRPERTTYQLTTAGLKEFHVLLREEWWTVRTPTDPLMAAISFISYMPRDEAIAALEQRTAQIHSLVRNLETAQTSIDGIESPYHVREMHSLLMARVSAELAWSKQFAERLRNHEYTTGDDPPWQPQQAVATAPAAKPARNSAAPRGAAKVKAGRASGVAANATRAPASDVAAKATRTPASDAAAKATRTPASGAAAKATRTTASGVAAKATRAPASGATAKATRVPADVATKTNGASRGAAAKARGAAAKTGAGDASAGNGQWLTSRRAPTKKSSGASD